MCVRVTSLCWIEFNCRNLCRSFYSSLDLFMCSSFHFLHVPLVYMYCVSQLMCLQLMLYDQMFNVHALWPNGSLCVVFFFPVYERAFICTHTLKTHTSTCIHAISFECSWLGWPAITNEKTNESLIGFNRRLREVGCAKQAFTKQQVLMYVMIELFTREKFPIVHFVQWSWV